MKTASSTYDAIIVGAGPAGLTAAIYLGRFRRRCIVVEDGQSRARWIPTSHNIPGFTAGVGGEEFLSMLRAQALRYGAEVRHASAYSLTSEEGMFALQADGQVLYSRYVLLATGVRDRLPDIAGASEAVLRSVLRVCPICDAFEAVDKRIAVIGDGALGEREAAFLTNYSRHVTLLHTSTASVSTRDELSARGIELIQAKLADLHLHRDCATLQSEQNKRDFDVVYLALGCSPQHDLAQSMRASCDEHGALKVNAHQETSVPSLYAAGDVVRGLNQVVVAAAESAIAATDIHNKLRGA